MVADVGSLAPDFTLKDQNNEDVTLSEFRGRRAAVVVFYPLTFTDICRNELSAIRDDLAGFQNDEVQVLAVSVDSSFAHKVWATEQGYDFPLLADFWPHGEVAQTYGVFDDEKGVARRGTFIIDKQGVVRWTTVNQISEARDLGEYRQALASL